MSAFPGRFYEHRKIIKCAANSVRSKRFTHMGTKNPTLHYFPFPRRLCVKLPVFLLFLCFSDSGGRIFLRRFVFQVIIAGGNAQQSKSTNDKDIVSLLHRQPKAGLQRTRFFIRHSASVSKPGGDGNPLWAFRWRFREEAGLGAGQAAPRVEFPVRESGAARAAGEVEGRRAGHASGIASGHSS